MIANREILLTGAIVETVTGPEGTPRDFIEASLSHPDIGSHGVKHAVDKSADQSQRDWARSMVLRRLATAVKDRFVIDRSPMLEVTVFVLELGEMVLRTGVPTERLTPELTAQIEKTFREAAAKWIEAGV